MDIHIGLLHRGTESLITTKYYEKSIPYFDRLDYVSMMSQEHGFVLALENILDQTNKNILVSYVRILFDEITRILNHLLAIACHALDIGSMSSIFWAFEERELLMEFYEKASGARMHAAYHKTQQNFIIDEKTFTPDFLSRIILFTEGCFKTLNEMHNALTYNKIWKARLVNIGTIGLLDCKNYSLTGVMLRSVGCKRDLRLSIHSNYSKYNLLNINSFIGLCGDSFDRYLIRMLEMGESLNIINSVAQLINSHIKKVNTSNNIYNLIHTKDTTKHYTSMEDLIIQFLRWHEGFLVKENTTTSLIESPKGEFGVSLISDGSCKPMYCKIRSPSYFNLQALPRLAKGHYLADLAAIIGTIDIVFGEIDR